MIMVPRISFLLLSSLSLIGKVYGSPFAIVTTGKPVCQTLELAGETVVKILFEAPDLVLDGAEGIAGPTYLTIHETLVQTAQEFIDEEEGRPAKRKPKPPSPVSFELKEKSGIFVHTVRHDADVSVCIRASTAGSTNPMMFALRFEELGEDEASQSGNPPASVDHHLSYMEQQLDRIEMQMHALIKEADYAKERDSIYHAKTDAMNKATTFWPIVHVCILLATGFTQANHIVQFFKKRRII